MNRVTYGNLVFNEEGLDDLSRCQELDDEKCESKRLDDKTDESEGYDAEGPEVS